MKLSKGLAVFCLVIFFAFSMFYCGSSPAEEGENAFENGNYNLAIKLFLEAKKQNPDDNNINEKLALSYMFRGKDLFEKTKNIKSFSGNFEKATNFIPESSSQEFKKNYSNILYALANGYINSTPQNEIEKEEFLNKSITYLEDAIYQDENNSEAEGLLAQIKSDNFQKMLDKGTDFFNKASKQKKNDMFFTAEYYFKKAAYFDTHNEEAKTWLSKTREKTLSILDIQEDLSIAVADYVNQSGKFIIDLVMHNYGMDPVEIKLQNFELADLEGKTYTLDENYMNSKFAKKKVKNQKLAELKNIEGYLVFSVPSGTKIEYLGYKLNEEKIFKKYFP
jgi:hypothetical protein